MESNKRTNIDVMLDELKQIVPPGKDSFSTASEFKKDFMAKVKQLKPVNSPLSKLKFYAAATVVAATMLGALSFLDLDSTSSIPAIYAPEWDGTVSARKNGFIGYSDSDIPEINDIPILNTEEYKGFIPNTFLSTKEQSLSTFGADVDTASYTNVRRMLMLESILPPV